MRIVKFAAGVPDGTAAFGRKGWMRFSTVMGPCSFVRGMSGVSEKLHTATDAYHTGHTNRIL